MVTRRTGGGEFPGLRIDGAADQDPIRLCRGDAERRAQQVEHGLERGVGRKQCELEVPEAKAADNRSHRVERGRAQAQKPRAAANDDLLGRDDLRQSIDDLDGGGCRLNRTCQKRGDDGDEGSRSESHGVVQSKALANHRTVSFQTVVEATERAKWELVALAPLRLAKSASWSVVPPPRGGAATLRRSGAAQSVSLQLEPEILPVNAGPASGLGDVVAGRAKETVEVGPFEPLQGLGASGVERLEDPVPRRCDRSLDSQDRFAVRRIDA